MFKPDMVKMMDTNNISRNLEATKQIFNKYWTNASSEQKDMAMNQGAYTSHNPFLKARQTGKISARMVVCMAIVFKINPFLLIASETNKDVPLSDEVLLEFVSYFGFEDLLVAFGYDNKARKEIKNTAKPIIRESSAGFFEGIKELLSERDKTVKVRNYLYTKLVEEYGTDNPIEINQLINKILAERNEVIESSKKLKVEQELHDEELIDYYLFLDKYLYSTLNKSVLIGITNGLIGYEGANDYYVLKDYELSYTYKYLALELEQNKRVYPIKFYNIKDIKFLDNSERLKTWIYMPSETWRFYLEYDQNIPKGNLVSGRLDLTK